MRTLHIVPLIKTIREDGTVKTKVDFGGITKGFALCVPTDDIPGENHGKPLVEYCLMAVVEPTGAIPTSAVTPAEVSKSDKLHIIAEMVRGKDADGLAAVLETLQMFSPAERLACVAACRSRSGTRDAIFFNAIDMAGATVAQRRVVEDVLLQTVARGFPGHGAESIRVRLGLPEAADRAPGEGR